MDFSAAIEAQLAGYTVRRGRLVWFDFASGPIGVWNGWRNLTLPDGRKFLGMRNLGSIEGIRQPINGATPELLFTVTGVPETFLAKARMEAAEYYNRGVWIYSQFFDADLQPLDSPFVEAFGLMQGLRAKRQSTPEGFVRTVTLTAENPLATTKRRPRNSYMTDTDQKQRFPGDRGAENVAGIEQILIRFP